jgi:hypothetical protein
MNTHPQSLIKIFISLAAFLAVMSVLRAADAPAPSWGQVADKSTDSLEQVIWDGKQFIAVGGKAAWSSTDGANWTRHAIESAKNALDAVAGNGTMTVAVGSSGEIISSPDLTQWTEYTVGESKKFSIVFWTGSQFLAIADAGGSATSPDGVQWQKGGPMGNFNYMHGIWNNGRMAVGGKNVLVFSPDGSALKPVVRNSGPMYDVTFGNNLFVAVGSSQNSTLVSTDGKTWTHNDTGAAGDLRGVCWDGAQFVAVGNKGAMVVSPDGAKWQLADSGTKDELTSITSNGSATVAVSSSGAIFSTSFAKLVVLTHATLTPIAAAAHAASASIGSGTGPLDHWSLMDKTQLHACQQIVWDGKEFLASTWAKVLTSADGQTWTGHSLSGRGLYDIATNGQVYVTVGERGQITTSSDLDSWANHTITSISETLTTVIWNGKQFVALGSNGILVTSPDGTNWSQQSSGTTDSFRHGVWSRDQFMVSDASGGILTSKEGAPWSVALDTKTKTNCVTDNGTLYVAMATSEPTALTSTDGVKWTPQKTGASGGCSAVAWTGAEFVAVGPNGTLVSSTDGVTWTVHDFDKAITLTSVAAHDGTIVLGASTGYLYANKVLPPASTPVISLAKVSDGARPEIALKGGSASAKIYYTTDGSDPTNQSTLYAKPFAVSHAEVIKARVYMDGFAPSDIAAAECKLDAGP